MSNPSLLYYVAALLQVPCPEPHTSPSGQVNYAIGKEPVEWGGGGPHDHFADVSLLAVPSLRDMAAPPHYLPHRFRWGAVVLLGLEHLRTTLQADMPLDTPLPPPQAPSPPL